jgi:hypothetical protein
MKNKNDKVMLEISDKNMKSEIGQKENVVKKGGFWICKCTMSIAIMAIASCVSLEDVECRLPKYMAHAAAELLIVRTGLASGSDGRHKMASEMASKIVNFVYSTASRNSLGAWMKSRVQGGRIYKNTKDDAISQQFTKFLESVLGTYAENLNFNKLVNVAFPCWTGTMTCYMMNSSNLCFYALKNNCLTDACKLFLGFEGKPIGYTFSKIITDYKGDERKIIGIMFTLEALDTWEDLLTVIGTKESKPKYPEEDYDQYDVVPVPNTSYNFKFLLQGSCMISTIRNLLFIFCRHKVGKNSYILNFSGLNPEISTFLETHYCASKMHLDFLDQVKDHAQYSVEIDPKLINRIAEEFAKTVPDPSAPTFFSSVLELQKLVIDADLAKIARVSGITNLKEQTDWADALNSVGALGAPNLLGLLSALIVIRKDKSSAGDDIPKDDLIAIGNKVAYCLNSAKGGGTDIRATLKTNGEGVKWPQLILTIIDSRANKKVDVGIGTVGKGEHIEIINIE